MFLVPAAIIRTPATNNKQKQGKPVLSPYIYNKVEVSH